MKEDLYSINESKSFSSEDSTIFEYVNTNIKNQIEINLKDPYTHKEEKYQLINEKNEMLLCKEDLFDKVKDEIGESYDIKIIELLKRKDEKDYYYINKEELKQRYLKNFFDLDKINKELLFNRNNPIEMKKLYEETIKKHPRIIYKDHIEKYPFFAWSGFFCCKRNEFYDLGLGISSYFKMVKLFIVFFFIISCINVYAIFHYSKYQSILKNDSWALKTTLGNTMITNYKLFINLNKNYLNCSDKIIGKIIFGIRFDNLEENDLQQLTNYVANNNENPPPNLTSFNYSESIKYSRIENDELITYNQKINRCFLKNECEFNSSTLSNNIYDLLFYECIDKNVTLNNDIPQNSLKKITLITTISTTVLFIILYYFYKFSIIYENNEYHKNKIIINNYTLKLSNLNFHTYDYYQEINNLIKHLNTIILKEIEKNKDYFKQQDEGLNFSVGIEFKNIDYLNIFDISISTVDKNKMDVIESIKTFKEEIKNIKIDNDTISKKIKNKLKHVYKDFHTLYNNITETKKNKKNKKNKGDELDELEDIDLALIPNESENLLKAPTLSLSKTKIIKIKDKKEKIKSNIIKISEDIIKLHIDNKRANFVDIYITFRNPSISNYIYNIYNKNKFKRFLYYLFCQGYKIKKYYYEKQWLNFDLCNTGPNDINWENFYYSNKRRRFQKVITFIISFIIIIITIVIIIFLKWAFYESLTFVSTSISLLIVIVNIVSITILEKFTLFEKNITLTNNVSSNILKSFILNSIVSTILIHISSKFSLIFTYEYFEDYFKVILSVITSMIFVTFSANGSAIYSYLKNLKNRYLDSKCNNGKTTKKKDKSEYEELYVGEEFPIGQRYSTILVNLTICFLYGSFCPIIYLFFTLFLIAIFIVDKFLMINYYKKPSYYNIYLSKRVQYYYIIGIILHFYGTIYHLSNPYLFNYYQNNDFNETYISEIFYLIANPFAIFFYFQSDNDDKLSILVFNFSSLSQLYALILIYLFIFPFIIINIITFLLHKYKKSKSLQNAPIYDIGLIYSVEELKKYYEIKKLEFLKFLLGCEYDVKVIDNYYYLAYNYKLIIDYLKENIEFRNSFIFQNDEIKNEISDDNKLLEESINIQNKEEKNDHLISDDYLSYNLTFIPKYEIYSYFDLLYYT